jgi:hypothetical protein
MAEYYGPAPPTKNPINKRMLLIVGTIGIVAILLIVGILYFTITSALAKYAPVKHGPLPKPSIGASLADQDLLDYNNANQYIPFALVSYSAHNVSKINLNASLYTYPPPRQIYLLNISNQCFDCGNTQAIVNTMENRLMRYNLIQSPSNITILSPSQLQSLPNDSLLIVINGLLPSTFFAPSSNGNTTLVIDSLLNRHISILYAGQSFANELLPDSVVTPTQNMPYYLISYPYSGNAIKDKGAFYFTNSTFAFTNGTIYAGVLSYINALNGSVATFPNTPSSWHNSTDAGVDLAKAVQIMFWLPKYGYGTRTINLTSYNSSGQLGVLMNSKKLYFNSSLPAIVTQNGSIRVVLNANGSYSGAVSNSTYQYVYAKPSIFYNGTFGITNSMITNQTIPLTFKIATHTPVLINIQPHITVYDLNMTQVFSTPLPFIHNVTSNFTFILPYQRLILPPGTGYIIKLQSFQSTEYSAAFFNVSPISLYITSANVTVDQFGFHVSSQNKPITNLPYTIVLNNLYPSNGIIKNGSIYYAVPTGTPTIRGNLNFTLTVSNTKFYYNTGYNPLPFSINSEYLEVGIVIVLMLVMIVFVRAPNRDEFYIDVPSLPEEKKIPIILKASDIVGIFDKLNASYHWKYMPLSKAEIRSAIYTNLKFNSIPVGLTYSNIERMLDQLTVNDYLVSTDDLYAPKGWIAQSKHDIEYLATFKKLRLYLVTHGYIFTDLDMSTNSDITATLHSERKYIIIYSETSKFQKIPIYSDSKTYITFLNSYRLEEFKANLYNATTPEAEELKMYISADYIKLIDADNPEGLLN